MGVGVTLGQGYMLAEPEMLDPIATVGAAQPSATRCRFFSEEHPHGQCSTSGER